jgi:putative chitinase
MNKSKFLEYARRAPFGGRLTPQQRDGLSRILAHWDESGLTDNRWLAYMLATTFHETNATMQPIREAGGEKYLKSKPYYPWVGNGLVQITWEDNYRKYGLTRPEQAREWPNALHIMFDGMTNGKFTGKALKHYFNDRKNDPVGARKIINGTDKQHLIAGYHKAFLDAINHATLEELGEIDSMAPESPVDGDETFSATRLLGDPSVGSVGASMASGIGASLLGYIETPWAMGAAVALGITCIICITWYLNQRRKEKFTHGV